MIRVLPWLVLIGGAAAISLILSVARNRSEDIPVLKPPQEPVHA